MNKRGLEQFFCIFQNHSYICSHKSNIPAIKGCLVFIKKGEEIRLCETLATDHDLSGERCQNLIPESREMIKIKHGNHEFNSSDPQQLHHAAYAYAHVPVMNSTRGAITF